MSEQSDFHEIRADVAAVKAQMAGTERELSEFRQDVRSAIESLGTSLIAAVNKLDGEFERRETKFEQAITKLYETIDQRTQFNWQPIAVLVAGVSVLVAIIIAVSGFWIQKSDSSIRAQIESVTREAESERSSILERFDERTMSIRELSLLLNEHLKETVNAKFIDITGDIENQALLTDAKIEGLENQILPRLVALEKAVDDIPEWRERFRWMQGEKEAEVKDLQSRVRRLEDLLISRLRQGGT